MTRQNLSAIKSSAVQILFADVQKQIVARSKTTAPAHSANRLLYSHNSQSSFRYL